MKAKDIQKWRYKDGRYQRYDGYNWYNIDISDLDEILTLVVSLIVENGDLKKELVKPKEEE